MEAVDPLARAIAIAGFVLSVISVGVTVAAYLRDRVHLTVTLSPPMQYRYSAAEREMRTDLYEADRSMAARAGEASYMEDPNAVWVFVTTVNDGRRPVTFQKAGLYVPSDPNSFYTGIDSVVKRLDEGEHTDVKIAQAQLKNVAVLCAFAEDIRGRLYFSKIPRTWPGFVLQVKRFLRLPLAKDST